jgi:hypothetical protein
MTSPYSWDAASARYRHRGTGRFVARTEITRALSFSLAQEERRAISLANALREGSLSLAAWRTEMRTMIKSVHLYSAAAAKGGWAQLTQADYGRVGAIVRDEYQYLEAFTAKLATGLMPLDGRAAGYARQYALAGRETYYQVDRAANEAAGYTLETNLLHGGDHCLGCLEATALSPAPIGTLPPIGARDCRRHCLCTLVYS